MNLILGTSKLAAANNMLYLHKIRYFLSSIQNDEETAIDTAPLYSSGDAERILGRYLPESVYPGVQISTKFGRRVAKGVFPINRIAQKLMNMQYNFQSIYQNPLDSGYIYQDPRDSLVKHFRDSLSRLHRSRIDTYFFHGVNSDSVLDLQLEALLELKSSGKISAIGISTNERGVTIPREVGILQIPFRLIDHYRHIRNVQFQVHSLFEGVQDNIREVNSRINKLKEIENVKSVVVGTTNIEHFFALKEMVMR